LPHLPPRLQLPLRPQREPLRGARVRPLHEGVPQRGDAAGRGGRHRQGPGVLPVRIEAMRTALLIIASLSVAACNGGATLDYKAMHDDRPEILDPGSNPDNAPDMMACDFGYSYEGFGGTRLEAGRADEEVGFDRDRVKP